MNELMNECAAQQSSAQHSAASTRTHAPHTVAHKAPLHSSPSFWSLSSTRVLHAAPSVSLGVHPLNTRLWLSQPFGRDASSDHHEYFTTAAPHEDLLERAPEQLEAAPSRCCLSALGTYVDNFKEDAASEASTVTSTKGTVSADLRNLLPASLTGKVWLGYSWQRSFS